MRAIQGELKCNSDFDKLVGGQVWMILWLELSILVPDADVAIDFLGPLPSGDYLLVIIDCFSRYKEVEVLRKITACETANRLESIFVRLGYPRTITLDNGRQFVSNEFDEYCKTRGIVLNRTTPYWPQENGLVERQNRSLVKRLKISQALKKDWKQDLFAYLSMYYSTPQSTTGKTPTELMYGRNIRTKLPSLQDITTAVPFTDFADRDQQAKEKGKERGDVRRRAKPSGLVVGDKVLEKNLIPGNKLTPTFNPSVMTVTAKEGARVTVEDNNRRVYQRNCSHLKKLGSEQNYADKGEALNVMAPVGDHHEVERLRSSELLMERPDESSTTAADLSSDPASPLAASSSPVVTMPSEGGRARRNTKMPNRFNDCVMEY
ncbi:uncharacterized protein K02A2.6-like [Toxorhynchites rutilus septentrionalis]|uniref:uncharacterized protein K02A2.6-like n=1 Tax=Toxorhynchites rutilus septentrionalis TaxID=329112 RepID=UPI00247AA448|nr:uncharacterized protein K02A2.6-like [Toxorhynchites rutilus septentrionalis]